MSLHLETLNVSFACTMCELQGIKNGSLDNLLGKADKKKNCVMNCDVFFLFFVFFEGWGFDSVLKDFLCCFMYHYLALICAKNFSSGKFKFQVEIQTFFLLLLLFFLVDTGELF